MYVVIEKTTEKVYVFKQKTTLATFLGVHRHTISNKEGVGKWEKGNYLVYNASFIEGKR